MKMPDEDGDYDERDLLDRILFGMWPAILGIIVIIFALVLLIRS